MNTALLIRVRDHILAEPRRLNMSNWWQIGTPGSLVSNSFEVGQKGGHYTRLNRRTAPPCGTVACIAGWTNILREGDKSLPPRWKAQKSLQISSSQFETLFYPFNWPEPFRSRYPKCRSAKARAVLVAKFIDYFIEKDGNMKNQIHR